MCHSVPSPPLNNDILRCIWSLDRIVKMLVAEGHFSHNNKCIKENEHWQHRTAESKSSCRIYLFYQTNWTNPNHCASAIANYYHGALKHLICVRIVGDYDFWLVEMLIKCEHFVSPQSISLSHFNMLEPITQWNPPLICHEPYQSKVQSGNTKGAQNQWYHNLIDLSNKCQGSWGYSSKGLSTTSPRGIMALFNLSCNDSS